MDGEQSFFAIEKEFSKYNKYMATALALYYIIILLFGRYTNEKEVLLAFVVVLLLLADSYIGNRFYWNHKFVFRAIKLCILQFCAVSMIYHAGIYLSIAVMTTIYIAIVFQYFFLYDVVEYFYRITALIETMLPLSMAVLGYYIFLGKTNFDVFLITAFIATVAISIMCDLNVASSIINKLLNDMFRKERLAINSHKEYENLKEYQSRLVHANEQLSIQKFQMEQLNEKINKRNKQMDLQYRILKHITSALDLEKLMDFITSGIVDNINVDLCIVFVYETTSNSEVKEKFYNIKYTEESYLNERTMDLFIEYAQEEEFQQFEGECMVCNNVEAGRYEFLKNSKISSLLLYPINISSERQGVLAIGKNSSGYFTEHNKDFYKSIVEQIILAVNNASMYTKMQDMATKDPLTSIYNRRHFTAIYPQFMTKAIETKQPLTVVLFDIDKFKNVNDQYGHLFGDQVIRYCGSLAGKVAKRNAGMAVRYGGEEFVIIFPNKNVETVFRIVEDMHEQIKEKEFEYEGEIVHINVSVGIASYPETCEQLEELLNRSDLAMYHSKNTGRGRITIDSAKVRGEE